MVMAARPDRYISARLHHPGPRHSAAIRDAGLENLAKYDQLLHGSARFSIALVVGWMEGSEGWMGWLVTIGWRSWLKPSLREARFQPHNPSAGAHTVQFRGTTIKQFTQLFAKPRKLQVWERGGRYSYSHTPPAIRDHISAPPW